MNGNRALITKTSVVERCLQAGLWTHTGKTSQFCGWLAVYEVVRLIVCDTIFNSLLAEKQ